MKFTTKSVLMKKKGIPFVAEIFIPKEITDYEISQDIWEKSIKDFNEKLNARESVTQKVDETEVDILGLAASIRENFKLGEVFMLLIIPQENTEKFDHLRFVLKGDLILTEGIDKKVEAMDIKNITYVGSNGKRHHILREKKEEDK